MLVLNDVDSGWPLLVLSRNAAKVPLSKELVIMDEETNPTCDLGFKSAIKREEVVR